MKSIATNIINEISIKHSKFICHLYRVDTIDEINEIISKIQKEYKDATHNCYAYICDSKKKASDDGEPNGTAGLPILNILEINELDHVLAIVTRYFGGIKLGANGLVRAYADSVKDALTKTKIISLIPGIQIKLTFSYDNIKQIDYLLNNFEIKDKKYEDNICYIVNIKQDSELLNQLTKYGEYEIIDNILIKEETK